MGHGPFRGLGLLLLLRIIYHKRRRRRRRLLTRTAAAANTIHLDGRFPFLLPLPFSRFYFSLHSVSTNWLTEKREQEKKNCASASFTNLAKKNIHSTKRAQLFYSLFDECDWVQPTHSKIDATKVFIWPFFLLFFFFWLFSQSDKIKIWGKPRHANVWGKGTLLFGVFWKLLVAIESSIWSPVWFWCVCVHSHDIPCWWWARIEMARLERLLCCVSVLTVIDWGVQLTYSPLYCTYSPGPSLLSGWPSALVAYIALLLLPSWFNRLSFSFFSPFFLLFLWRSFLVIARSYSWPIALIYIYSPCPI